jgi:uncharacterized integral membrane protein (TIGR00697 family)
MNEILFLTHSLLVIGCVLAALRWGKIALIALAVIQAVLANLFVVKQIELFGLAATCSDVFAVGGIFAINLLQEFFGKEAAKQAMQVCFLSLIFFACMSQIHLLYTPSAADAAQGSFLALFSLTPRIVFASASTFYVVQRFDIVLFGALKNLFGQQRLAMRVAISLVFSQLLDTVLFSFFGLYGVVGSLFEIIVISFLIKCATIACAAPFVTFARRFVKEGA